MSYIMIQSAMSKAHLRHRVDPTVGRNCEKFGAKFSQFIIDKMS